MAVTVPERLEKQPGETRSFTMDFSGLMSTGQTISSISSVVSELRGGGTSDLSVSSEAISGQTVTMTIAGGTHGNTYRIEVIIVTSASETLEGDGLLVVTDR